MVEADASSNGIGAVLSKKRQPIAFFSKALSANQQILSVYEKEMLVILIAVKKWSSYLLGRHFVIMTDHSSLQFLLQQETWTPTQQKWAMKMMGFDYEVVYRKETYNVVAGALSRIPMQDFNALSTFHRELVDKINASWSSDAVLGFLLQKLNSQNGIYKKYIWQNVMLRRNEKLVIGPDLDLRTELL